MIKSVVIRHTKTFMALMSRKKAVSDLAHYITGIA